MKYVVALLSLISVVYSHEGNHPPPFDPNITYPAFFFNGYKVDGVFDIARIGSDRTNALKCHTDLDTCCGVEQGFHSGNWFAPNGKQLELNSSRDRGHMFQTRELSQVNLYRDGIYIQEGDYCCEIETIEKHRENRIDAYEPAKKCIHLFDFTRECPELDAPENGGLTIHGDGAYLSVAEFSCNTGYILKGEVNLTCIAGSWDYTPPMCEDSCLPKGKEWRDCGSGCPVTCENYDYINETFCTTVCSPGCFCKDGYILDNDTCVKPHKCPNWCCEPHLPSGTYDVTGYSTGDRINFTCDDGFEPVGLTHGVCQADRTWTIEPYCRGCAISLYIMAFTSTVPNGGSDRHHDLFISFRNGSNTTIAFFNRKGDDMFENKGDLWKFVLSDYGISCMNYHDIKKVAIVGSNTDTWHIESITSLLSVNTHRGVHYAPLTIDMEANHWISSFSTHSSLNLTEYASVEDCVPTLCPRRPDHPGPPDRPTPTDSSRPTGRTDPTSPTPTEGSGSPEPTDRPMRPRRRRCPPPSCPRRYYFD